MILIISNKADTTTYDVENWLRYYNIEHFRINDCDTVQVENLALTNNAYDFRIIVEDTVIQFSDIKSVWYRRGFINFIDNNLKSDFIENENIRKKLNTHKRSELENIHQYLFELLKQKKHISSYNTQDVNKLIVLHLAQEVGLHIPDSFIGSNLSPTAGEFITKSISGSTPDFYNGDTFIQFYTSEVDESMQSTFPSFIQKKINKKYEIRTFYLNEKMYSMAIFSQADEQTQVDFRNYNYQRPNRTVPYQLPENIEEKTIHLMQKLNLNSGSIDFIVDINNKIYFLEINPIGQFGMVSFPCNYFLEEKVALELIN